MILENQELKLTNLISLRKNMTQQEVSNEMVKMQQYLKGTGVEKIGGTLTVTFNVVQAIVPTMDMEILIPINKELPDTLNYKFKKEILITNAIKAVHKGNTATLQNTFNQINTYIMQNKLQQITPAYTITIKDAKDISEIEHIEIHIYVGISPNKL